MTSKESYELAEQIEEFFVINKYPYKTNHLFCSNSWHYQFILNIDNTNNKLPKSFYVCIDSILDYVPNKARRERHYFCHIHINQVASYNEQGLVAKLNGVDFYMENFNAVIDFIESHYNKLTETTDLI